MGFEIADLRKTGVRRREPENRRREPGDEGGNSQGEDEDGAGGR